MRLRATCKLSLRSTSPLIVLHIEAGGRSAELTIDQAGKELDLVVDVPPGGADVRLTCGVPAEQPVEGPLRRRYTFVMHNLDCEELRAAPSTAACAR